MMEKATTSVGANDSSSQPPSVAKQVFEFVWMVAVAVALAFLIRTFLVQPYIIPTGSMIPTIEISDRVLADKLTYRFREPQPGEIVVFPDPTGENPTLIKRLIAVEGQTVDIRDGVVFVDGVQLDEPYVYGKETNILPQTADRFPLTLADGAGWVMGDNRPNSGDSRIFGPIKMDTIEGRGFFTYWPPKEMGPLK